MFGNECSHFKLRIVVINLAAAVAVAMAVALAMAVAVAVFLVGTVSWIPVAGP